jgi:L-threonylcarbamoyladenylate synthase
VALRVLWPQDPVEQELLAARAAEVLRCGGLVIFPTDTVYGLGAAPSISTAVQRIYDAKGRPDEKALVWLVDSIDAARAWCDVDARAEALARQFWPGGLTLVLRRLAPAAGSLPNLGVRVPAHAAALAILRAVGGPVATTSANRSGEPSARTAADAEAGLGAQVDLIIDAGPALGGIESTVVDLSTDPPTILRAGAIDSGAIETALGLSLQRL